MSFPYADLADAIHAGLQAENDRIDLEQSVFGLDARDELELHPVIAAGMTAAGFGVHREQRYPADRRKRKETEGERCDFVVTGEGRPLRHPDRDPTLFDDPDAVELDDALWLEVKVVGQYDLEGANGSYSSQLLSTVGRDVTKLSKDGGILHAAILIVMFVHEPAVAAHDLGVWQTRCLERGLPIGAPYLRELPIQDRLGNRTCVAAMYPVHHL